MGEPNVIINKKNEAFLAKGLELIKPDLANYNEIYIISPDDLYPKMDKDGLPVLELLERGELFKKLANHPEYFAGLANLMADFRKSDDSKEPDEVQWASTITMNVSDKDNSDHKVGIILLPRKVAHWEDLSPKGISHKTRDELRESYTRERKEIANFIVLAHEAGHLVADMNGNNLTLDTKVPFKEMLAQQRNKNPSKALDDEIAGDEYMVGIFEKAKDRGYIQHPDIVNRFLNYRTMTAVDRALLNGEFEEHATTLFNKGSVFEGAQVNHKGEYATFTAKSFQSAANLAISEAFNTLGKSIQTQPWVQVAETCLQGSIVGWRDTHLTHDRLKAEFTSCAKNDLDMRSGVIRQVTENASPGTALHEIGKVYDRAVRTEFAEEIKSVAPKSSIPAFTR